MRRGVLKKVLEIHVGVACEEVHVRHAVLFHILASGIHQLTANLEAEVVDVCIGLCGLQAEEPSRAANVDVQWLCGLFEEYRGPLLR